MSNLYRGPSIDIYTSYVYQVSVHLAVVSEEKTFRNRPIRNNNCLWWPYLLMDRDEMSIPYREPSIDVSYQVSVHWLNGFRGEESKKSANQKKELPVVAMFVNGSGRNEQCI